MYTTCKKKIKKSIDPKGKDKILTVAVEHHLTSQSHHSNRHRSRIKLNFYWKFLRLAQQLPISTKLQIR